MQSIENYYMHRDSVNYWINQIRPQANEKQKMHIKNIEQAFEEAEKTFLLFSKRVNDLQAATDWWNQARTKSENESLKYWKTNFNKLSNYVNGLAPLDSEIQAILNK